MSFSEFVNLLVVFDLFFTVFFHLIQLHRFCVLSRMAHDFEVFENKLNLVDQRTRCLYEESISGRDGGK